MKLSRAVGLNYHVYRCVSRLFHRVFGDLIIEGDYPYAVTGRTDVTQVKANVIIFGLHGGFQRTFDNVYPVRLRTCQIYVACYVHVRYFYVLLSNECNLSGNLGLKSLESFWAAHGCVLKDIVKTVEFVSELIIERIFVLPRGVGYKF